jgi:hypothetical protein
MLAKGLRHPLQPKMPEASNIPSGRQIGRSFAASAEGGQLLCAAKPDRLFGKTVSIRRASFFHMTTRKSRFAALPVPEVVR